jgi:microcystin-dependent protein
MANYEATRYDFDGANLLGIEGIPTATIVPWSTASVPSGFLECNGQAVSQSTYAALYAIIGTTYGDPGGGNFNVPDLQDNVAIGKSGTKNIASTGGANTVTNSGNISGNVAGSTANATLSTAQLASHSHPTNIGRPQTGQPSSDMLLINQRRSEFPNTGTAGSGSGHSHNMSANFSGNFTGSANSVVQPYLTIMYIIKT